MKRCLILMAALFLALPAQAQTFRVNDQDSFIWDLYTPYWYLSNGTGDAWDGMFYLSVNNVRFNNREMQQEFNGRGVRSGEVVMGNLRVRRVFWVPASNPSADLRNYGRYLTIVRNPTGQDQTANIVINGNLGSDGGTVSTGSSDGDNIFENTDTWVATDDASDGGGDPSIAFVFQDENARHRITSVLRSNDNMTFTWNNVTVPANGQVTLLFYAIQDRNRAASHAEARAIAALPDDVLAHLSDEERASLINFASNAPPTWDDLEPVDVFVGQQVRLRIGVTEADGDELEITVEGLPSGAVYQAAAGKLRWTPTLDQVGTHSIRFHAIEVREDGEDPLEDETTVEVTVHAMNRPPVFTTEPEIEVPQGERWSYRPDGTDLESPDELLLNLLEGPEGMTLEEGELTWLANQAPGTDIPVSLELQDADGARAFQNFDIRVAVNRHAPVAMVVQGDVERSPGEVELDGTASYDPNGGELFYHWRFVEGPLEAGTLEVASATQSIARTRPVKLGHYIYELTVNNGELSSRPAEFHVEVVNVAPVAVAGDDEELSLVEGDEVEVSLDGSASFDPNPEDIISFEWSQIGGPVVRSISDDNSDRPSFIATIPATYRFALIVTDQYNNKSVPSTVTVDLVDPTPKAGPRPVVPDSGCSSAPTSLFACFAVLGLLVRRRRRAWAH